MMRSDIAELNDPGIVVKKGERRLELYDGDEFIKAFTIVLGSAPDGDKNVEGDGRTPVGDFYIFTKNPESKFHLSLGISYPDGRAAERGLGSGLIDEAEYDAIRQAIAERSMPPQRSAARYTFTAAGQNATGRTGASLSPIRISRNFSMPFGSVRLLRSLHNDGSKFCRRGQVGRNIKLTPRPSPHVL